MEKLYLANSVVLKPGRVYQAERLSERGLYKTENGDTGWLRKHIWSDFVLKRRETNIDDGDTEYSKDKEMKCLQKDKQQEGEHDNRKKKVTGRKSRMTAVLLSAALTAAFCLNAPQTVEGQQQRMKHFKTQGCR